MVCPTIDNPASCEMRALISFINTETLELWKSIANYERFTVKM
jgi:hypothetical protein